MPLQSLTIRNFQAHRNLKVRFDPHVTTIVGESDRGKSAIIRSLRWLVENRPSGKEFIRHGRKSVSVSLKVDGSTIVRSKGKKNLYKINGKALASFSQTVPTGVSDILRMGPVNFQGQHDSPFWFTDSASQVSKNLNSVVDLSLMDDALAKLSAQLRKVKGRVELTKEDLLKAREDLRNLKGVRQAKKDLEPLLRQEKEFERLKGLTWVLKQAVSRASEAKRRQGQPPPDISALNAKETALSGLRGKVEGLKNLLGRAGRFKSQAKNCKRVLVMAEDNFRKQTKGQACPLCGSKIKHTHE